MRVNRSEIQEQIARANQTGCGPAGHRFRVRLLEGKPDVETQLRILGTLNRDAFCGAEPGTLFLTGFKVERVNPDLVNAYVDFAYKPESWRFPDFPASPYIALDFDALFPEAETWRNRPSLL